MTLDGKVAAITGASAGIGLAVAEHLSREGVAVVLGARRLDLIEQHVAKIRAAGGRAEAVKMDVTSEEDVTQLVVRAQEAFGGLDIMMCNAGFGFYGTVEQTPVNVMRRMMDVNFTGTFIGARAALPIFRRQGHGHLLITSSIAGRRGIPFMSGYSATKAAQAVFAEGLRSEFSGTDIHVTVIYPVSTSTEYHHAMERDYGQYISGLGPKQSVDARRAHGTRLPAAAAPRSVSTPEISRARGAERPRTEVHRRSGAAIRTQARREDRDIIMSIDIATEIAKRVVAEGGRALIVGGWVRDRLIGRSSKDIDIEVFGIPAAPLKALLENIAPVNVVGESFTVYKVADVDVALPRRESKVGEGHKGFAVEGDPSMSAEDAARRRDFTVNAIAWDPLREVYIDPFNGRVDLLERKVLRAVDARTFGDDSLRVLRGVQFAARFSLDMDAATKRSVPANPAGRSAGRARVGRDGEAAAPRGAAIGRLQPRAGAWRHHAPVPRAARARRLPAGARVAPRG